MGSTIPRTMADITPAWLTAALHERGVIGDAAVAGVRAETIGVGAGFLGQLARLRLSYDRAEANAPATMIAKMPTLDPGGREICRMFQFYEHEIRFYDEVAPDVSLRVPRAYYTAMDAAADDYLLLLEEITDARVGDEVAGCSAEEAEQAIRGIAGFHAAWWEHPRLAEMALGPEAQALENQSAEEAYNQAWEPFLQMFGDKLSPAMRAIGEELRTHLIDLIDAMAGPPLTIAHGDYRLDNIFFGAPGAAHPVAIIDWQLTGPGPGIGDVAFLLASCIDPAIRRAHERRLVELWHGIATGGRGEYSLDDAWTGYRRMVLFCNFYTVMGIANIDAGNERGSALFNVWFTRRNAAIEELNAGELMRR